MNNFICHERMPLLTAIAALCLLFGCAPDNSGAFTDARDGKRYKTVKMPNGKTWMAENLNYRTSGGSWCYGNYEPHCGIYGRLYNWETAMAVCPEGWHLPSKKEWDDMMESLGWWYSCYGDAGRMLKAKYGWIARRNGDDGNGIDLYGFSALPGGIFCDHTNRCEYKSRADGVNVGFFHGVGEVGNWWTTLSIRRYIYYGGYTNALRFTNDDYYNEFTYTDSEHGLSVRCVRDYIDPSEVARLMAEAEQRQIEEEQRQQKAEEQRQKDMEERIARNSGSFTDPRDGQTYRTMVIGGETWMAQNLNYRMRGGSWCYDDKNSNCDIYGRLYDWNTAMAACPPGWHLSTREEWKRLVKTVDGAGKFGSSERGGKKLKAESGWKNSWSDGTDEYGFAALPGGYRDFENEEDPYWNGNMGKDFWSGNMGKDFWSFNWNSWFKRNASHRSNYGGSWWTATEGAYGSAFSRYIRGDRDHVAEFNDVKDYGFSARCVGDRGIDADI